MEVLNYPKPIALKTKPNLQPILNDHTTLIENPISYFRHKGIKIKFSDIENALADYPYITGSAVVCSEDAEGNRRLVAYIIPSGTFNQADVTNFLSGRLQPVMIPAVWVCIPEFPLTGWGTIDKSALSQLRVAEVRPDTFVAPRNRTELKLAHIIQELLQVPNISIHDDFLQLGSNSLQALRIIAAMRKELNVSLDIKCFFLYPTIAKLAGYVHSVEAVKDATCIVQDTVHEPEPVLHNTCIVPIKTDGKKIPLYIVCGGGGTVFTFEKFAGMLDDQPVYGFQQPSGIHELEAFPDTIEGIAAKYVQELLLINPDGPYALSGHCIGGVIALEMARQLQAIGKKIHLLALFDVILTDDQENKKGVLLKRPGFTVRIKNAAKALLQKTAFELYLLAKYPKDALDYKREKIKELLNKFYPFWKENTDEMVFSKFELKFEEAYTNYKVTHFPGKILVFYATDHYRFTDRDRNIYYKKGSLSENVKNKWKRYAADVQIFDVDGNHSSIFHPLYAGRFAGLLQQHLQTEQQSLAYSK